ncbi:MAG: YchF/TatD family DNA exonuclease [Clostridia bacterium]
MNLFDSHCHLEDEGFADDRPEVLLRMAQAGVNRCILAGSDMLTSEEIVKLARENKMIYGVVGIHPHEAKGYEAGDLQQLAAWQREPKIVGLGEIGLDYFYDSSPREKQREVLEKQLKLAYELGVPAVFHVRDAHGDMLELLHAHRTELPAGVLHCYTGSVESAKQYLDMGFYLSFAGSITFKNAAKLPEVAKFCPKDRLLVETDSPYLAPVPMRGKRNEPSFVRYVAQTVADLRGVTAEELAQTAADNTCRLFGIKPMEPTVRKAALEDLEKMLAIFERARAFMEASGNPTQWGNSYPSEALLRQDMAMGQSYVCEENGHLLATFVLAEGVEPTYAHIDGAWKNNLPYGTLHRVAVSGERAGMADFIISWAFERTHSLRGDTHANNIPMQKAFERNGFEPCGVVKMADGTPRMAYQRVQ